MSQHTPGPWTFCDAPNQHIGEHPGWAIEAPYKRSVQLVAFCPNSPDARLIAKAPEMLALIRDFERNIVEDMNSIADHANNRDYMAARSLALQVQQIVAKRTRALLREIEGEK